MTPRLCSIDECTKVHYAKGWCRMHYMRNRRNGDPADYGTRVIGDDVARLWHYVTKTDTCWLWTGVRDRDGYGHMRINHADALVHRYSWELHRGPIPDGLDVDHLCFVRNCVNPDHLEPVTRAENNRRKHARDTSPTTT